MTRAKRSHRWLAAGVSLAVMWVALPVAAGGGPQRSKFTRADGSYLIIEVLDDDLLHLEYSANGPGPQLSSPLASSIMIDKNDYAGGSARVSGNVIETRELRATVAAATLCVSVRDLLRRVELTTVCPKDLAQAQKMLTLARGATQNAYGLGQQFHALGQADGDWIGKLREAQPSTQPQAHGNGFMPFGPAGLVGNVQFPVLYALGAGFNYAVFLDNVYRQEWDLRTDPWTVSMSGDAIRLYIMTGPDLRDLRSDYMELVGRPPVPPRKAFGLWISQYGYKGWWRIDQLKDSLRADGFPFDGFVLDLYWFGGVKPGAPDSAMGRLAWDDDPDDGNDDYFPHPDAKIAAYAREHVGLIAIEESYVAKNTKTYAEISAGRTPFAYARDAQHVCNPSQYKPITLSGWVGQSAMLDWSDPEVGAWIHEHRRFPNLVQKGVLGHWTDLGEPEKYDPEACYDGVVPGHLEHADIHNLYNLLWTRSIYEGYRAKNSQVNRRPFVLSRSGAPGTQRYGAAMWSGDIGSNLDLLASHLNAQMQMSFSGIDYYGADVGGFRREGLPFNGAHSLRQYESEMYTQWFANAAWFDVPLRPHTDVSFAQAASYQTAPNKVGVAASNLANLRQRYELIPYYYSLAHRAFLGGEPVIAPLVMNYQSDPYVRTLGQEKMIGRDVLVASVTKHGAYRRDVYLPEGLWFDYHSSETTVSHGEWRRDLPLYRAGVLRLPVFVRAGAILPQMRVDAGTLDAFDAQQAGGVASDLLVRVYAGAAATSFTLYEDDGTSLRFDARGKPVYATRTTELSQRSAGDVVTVAIAAASGEYAGAVRARDNQVRLVLPEREVTRVRIDGEDAPHIQDPAAFAAARGKAWRVEANVAYAKSGVRSVNEAKSFEFTSATAAARASAQFVCDNAWTKPGEHVAVIGDVAALGGGDPVRAVRLHPSVVYSYIIDPPGSGPGPATPKWTAVVSELPVRTQIAWKCAMVDDSGRVTRWAPGDSRIITTGASGYAGSGVCAF